MFEDRIEELEEVFDRIEDREPAVAKLLGEALDRLYDGKQIPPVQQVVIQAALDGKYDNL